MPLAVLFFRTRFVLGDKTPSLARLLSRTFSLSTGAEVRRRRNTRANRLCLRDLSSHVFVLLQWKPGCPVQRVEFRRRFDQEA